MTPALGVLWSHSVNTRLALDFGHLGTTKEQRRMTLAKSATAPVTAMAYVVEGAPLTSQAFCVLPSARSVCSFFQRQVLWSKSLVRIAVFTFRMC